MINGVGVSIAYLNISRRLWMIFRPSPLLPSHAQTHPFLMLTVWSHSAMICPLLLARIAQLVRALH